MITKDLHPTSFESEKRQQLQADSLLPACLPASVKAWPLGLQGTLSSSDHVQQLPGCSSTSCLH